MCLELTLKMKGRSWVEGEGGGGGGGGGGGEGGGGESEDESETVKKNGKCSYPRLRFVCYFLFFLNLSNSLWKKRTAFRHSFAFWLSGSI